MADRRGVLEREREKTNDGRFSQKKKVSTVAIEMEYILLSINDSSCDPGPWKTYRRRRRRVQ